MFDDSNLFRVDKYSGWDRVEGGGRANYGMQYTTQFNQGGFVSALFGQSYSMFGQNSFALGGTTNTGLNSGLDTTMLRLCGTAVVPAKQHLQVYFALPFRQRHLRRRSASSWKPAPTSTGGAAACSTATMPPSRYWASSTAKKAYWEPGRSRSTPIGFCSGGARYDIIAGKFDQTRVGLGYVDDCLILGLNYFTNYTYSGNVQANHTIMLQLDPAHAGRHVGKPGGRPARQTDHRRRDFRDIGN